MRARRGGSRFTIRQPWVVAFAFGLLHGFGFASGLAALGLPRAEIPLALLAGPPSPAGRGMCAAAARPASAHRLPYKPYLEYGQPI